MSKKVIVSLTTTPNRIPYLHRTLKSLQNQKLNIDSIELNVPYEYRRDDLGKVQLDLIPDGFEIYRCADFGPATKIVPTLKRYAAEDVMIIYCDDDRIYDPNWALRLANAHSKSGGACIFEEGADIPYFLRTVVKDWVYRVKRVVSLGVWSPFKVDRLKTEIVEGFGGVLVTPRMFDNFVYDIPNECFFVDDIWLSANLSRNNIPKVYSGRSRHQRSREVSVDGRDLGRLLGSLTVSSFQGKSRAHLNFAAIRYGIEKMNVWGEHEGLVREKSREFD